MQPLTHVQVQYITIVLGTPSVPILFLHEMSAAQRWWKSCWSGSKVDNGQYSDTRKPSGGCWNSSRRLQWWHSDQPVMGKDTISAGEQHTSPDHLGHYAANWPHIHWRWTFRWQGGGHANKMVRKKQKYRRRNKNANRMVLMCGNETEEHATSARYERQ